MSEPADVSDGGNVLVEPALDISQDAAASISGEVNRYPGSPPFGDTEVDRLLFRGRALETDEVLHSILSYDLYLVYAVSGMGKTSLLTAGVLEPLRQRGYFPVIVRLNSPTTGFLALIEAQIRQAGEAGGVEIEHAQSIGAIPTTPETLWDLLAELQAWRGNELQQLVLIFDQFEELFTLPWSSEQRSGFITQFGEVIRRHRVPSDNGASRQTLPPPNVKVVLCMREDFIGQLEELAVSVPQIMHRRFRLGALTPEQAQAAICEPAALDDPRLRTQRFAYSEGAALTILTFLRTKDERGKSVLTSAVDPSQLQIICQHVERSILPTKAAGPGGAVEITEGDLGGQDGLRRIVGDFYRRVLEEFQPKERKAIRHLCETGLISQTGRRLSQEEGEIQAHFDVTAETLRRLVDLRLVRSEPRVGSIYYELAHDTLTGPILAYRDAHRRKRRRKLLIAAVVVAGLTAAVLAASLLSRSERTEVAGVAPAVPIAIGDEVSGELGSPDFTSLYEVTAADQPLLVELRPSGFNGVLQISGLGDIGATQTQDLGPSGATEFAVIGAAEAHRIEVSGSGPGTFELSVRPANTRDVPIPGKIPAMRLPATGEPIVLQLTGTDDDAFVVTVEGVVPAGNQPEPIPAGAVLQVTGPDGATTVARSGDFVDQTFFEEELTRLSATAGGTSGTYLVSIADSSGSTALTYNISIDPIDITQAVLGESVVASMNLWQSRAVFEVTSPDDRPLYFELGDEEYASSGEVRSPDGAIHEVYPGSFAVVRGGPGRYLVFVTSYYPVQVTLTVDTAEGTEVGLGATATGTLDRDRGIALYRVQAPGGVPLLAEVTSDDTLDTMLSLVSTEDAAVTPVDFAGPGEPEQVIVPAGTTGSQLFAVTTFEGSFGTYEFTVRPATVQTLAIGDTMSGHIEPGELAAYTVTTIDETPFAVAFTSDDLLDAGLGVEGPRGDEFAQTQNLYVSSGTPGTYTLTVQSFASGGDFRIGAAPLPSEASLEQGPVEGTIRGPGHLLVFDVDVPVGSVRFVTITTDRDLEVDATVTDVAGNAISLAGEPITGSGTMTVADAPGRHRVIVTGVSGTGTVHVSAGGAEPTELRPGSVATLAASGSSEVAVFTAVPGDDLLAVSLRPRGDVTAALSIIDGGGNRLRDSDDVSTEPTTHVFDSRSGPMQLVVSVAGGRGEVDVRSSSLPSAATSVGDVESGSIRSPGDVVAYDVTADPFGAIEFSVTATAELDPQVLVIDPSGFPYVSEDVTAGETVEVCADGGLGLYRVVVGGAAGSTGDFRLTTGSGTAEEPDLEADASCFGVYP